MKNYYNYTTEERLNRRTKGIKTQEFFTPKEIVAQMCDLISEDDWKNKELNFFEACFGNGNFIVEIIRRKIEYGSTWLEALNHTYGLELMQDNVDECIERIIENIKEIDNEQLATEILKRNLVCKDIFEFDFENFTKIDICISNPPYNRALYLKILDVLVDYCDKLIFISPASWLINIRKTSSPSSKLSQKIKAKTEHHIDYVLIENYNREFKTSMYVPFSIIRYNKLEKFEKIYFSNCGEEKFVYDIYECNLVGDYKMIISILEKCQKFGDVMANHIYKNKN